MLGDFLGPREAPAAAVAHLTKFHGRQAEKTYQNWAVAKVPKISKIQSGAKISISAVPKSARAIRPGLVGRSRGEPFFVEKCGIFDGFVGPNVSRNGDLEGLGQKSGVGMPLGRRRAPSVAL